MKMDFLDTFKVVRPLPDTYKLDKNGMPIVKRNAVPIQSLRDIQYLNSQNLTSIRKHKNSLILFFSYDKMLQKYWDNPLKYIPLLQLSKLCCTPDFSIYPGMNKWEMSHNIYKNRWLGCLWQSYGVPVICSVSWADNSTFDICFSGIEKGSIVAVSTLGCTKVNKSLFLCGYKRMMDTIEPSLVIVYGNFIDGLFGDIILINYKDSFYENDEAKQLFLFPEKRIITIKEII